MNYKWLILLGVDLALAGGLAVLWLDEDYDLKNVTWKAPAAMVPSADSLQVVKVNEPLVAVAQLTSTTERPLFWPTRRPPPPPPPPEKAAEAAPDPFADMHVFGLIGGEGAAGAIIRTGGVTRRIKLGDAVGAWVLDGVDGRLLRFKDAAGQVRGLELKFVAQAKAASAGGAEPGVPAGGGAASGGVPMGWSPDGKQKPLDVLIAERRARRAAAIAAARAEQQSRAGKN
ncbi:hypothetical protein [Zoogloea sp.]|uniref:hypothetical protein n=1 Tax=Zoogloea sp. TaxID=49181 RepID=UPI0032209AA0